MFILTFDIGGTFIKYAIMNEDGEILEKNKVNTPRDSQESLFDVIEEIYKSSNYEIEGLAFSMPGTIDNERGYVYQGGALTYNSKNEFVSNLRKRINLPISIENDAKCAAEAEIWKGNLSDVNDGIVMVLGTGVGGALVKDKKVHKGKNFFAGEMSFILAKDVEKAGMEAALGACGSVPRLIKMIGKTKGNENIEGEKAFEFINNGDEEAIKIFNEYCRDLAIQIYNFQVLFDPEVVCIGGGISTQPIVIETLRQSLEKVYSNIPIPMPKANLKPCKFNNDSNLIGALYNYLKLNNNIGC